MTLSLLPTPTVGVSQVRFVNVPGSKNANMVEVLIRDYCHRNGVPIPEQQDLPLGESSPDVRNR